MKTKQLTTNWKEIELSELIKLKCGFAFKSNDFRDNGVNIVRISNFNNSKVNLKNSIKVPLNFVKKYSEFSLKDNDILIAMSGATTGKTGIVSKENLPCLLNQRVGRFEIADKKISWKYLYIIVNSQSFKNKILKIASGCAQPNISAKKIESIKIPLPFKNKKPDLEEQERIVKILEKAQKLKEKGKNANDLLDEYLKSVFYEMFYEKGYPEEKLENLCVIRRGASPRPIKKYLRGDIPWIKIGDGTKGGDIYMYSTKEKITKEGAKKSVMLKSGSFIFANCGVSLGFARIIKFDGCIHDGWLSFADLDKSKLDEIYLLKLINSLTDHLRKIAPDGTQPNLNTGIMKKIKIPLPPLPLQEKFAKIVQQIEKMKENLKKTNLNSNELFNSLTDKAFGGEL